MLRILCRTIEGIHRPMVSQGVSGLPTVDAANLPIGDNRSGAEVVVHVSLLADSLAELSELVEGLLKRLSHFVDWLNGLNRVRLVDIGLRVKRLKLWLAAHKMLKLSEAASDSSSIALDLPFFAASSELESVPIKGT